MSEQDKTLETAKKDLINSIIKPAIDLLLDLMNKIKRAKSTDELEEIVKTYNLYAKGKKKKS